MDNQRKGGLFGNYDPSLNGPVMSPYLNFDPALIAPAPGSEFIMPEGASARRGRFELAFSQIGGSVLVGAGIGGTNGILSGFRETRELAGAAKRTQMLNFVAKQGASSAQTLGVVALMYSVFGVVIGWARGVEDELNTLTAGTATGLLYKSTSGLKKCARGGAIGFGLAAAYCVVTSGEKIKEFLSSS